MQNNEILYTEADINNVKRRRLAIDIPNELLDKDETDYLDEDMEEDYETFRSLKEATHQGGYIDISKEVNSGYSYPERKDELFFDLSKTDDEVDEDIIKRKVIVREQGHQMSLLEIDDELKKIDDIIN